MSRRAWFEPVLFRFRFMVDGVLLREGVFGVPSVAPVSSFHTRPIFILKATLSRRTNGKAWKLLRKNCMPLRKSGSAKKTLLFLNVILSFIWC